MEKLMFDTEIERQKILNGIYPSRVIAGRQNKHIEGTTEFEQKREQMQRLSPGSEPAILHVDAQTLVDKYKGTGTIKTKGSEYPREIIDTDKIVGKTWVQSLSKYVDTKRIEIFYSSTGVHVVPVNNYRKG
jgi:hypothetical protein